jgi:hypothetical protein
VLDGEILIDAEIVIDGEGDRRRPARSSSASTRGPAGRR